jgi:hypothetical protein
MRTIADVQRLLTEVTVLGIENGASGETLAGFRREFRFLFRAMMNDYGKSGPEILSLPQETPLGAGATEHYRLIEELSKSTFFTL